MTTNARLISNSRSTFATRDAAILEGVPDELIVHTADDFFCSEDDTIKCDSCEAVYSDRHELDDDLLCEECAQYALDDKNHRQELEAAWGASRGCNMGKGW